jgi:hypothetical protein
MRGATDVFESALEWLRDNYGNFQFFVKRDIVWTMQTQILRITGQRDLPYKVFDRYPIIQTQLRTLSTDLAILDHNNHIELAAEFRYEPSHARVDILRSKLPVVSWNDEGLGKALRRIQEFTTKGEARVAYSVFVDEGGLHHTRPPHPNSKWIDWGNGVWVHCSVCYSQKQANP